MRTRVMNQLQAVALNEGVRRKKSLWRERGRHSAAGDLYAPEEWASFKGKPPDRELKSVSVEIGGVLGSVLKVGDVFEFTRDGNADFCYELVRDGTLMLAAGVVDCRRQLGTDLSPPRFRRIADDDLCILAVLQQGHQRVESGSGVKHGGKSAADELVRRRT